MEAFPTRAGVRVMRLDTETKAIYGMTAETAADPSEKPLFAVSPFHPDTVFANSFAMPACGRGAPAAKQPWYVADGSFPSDALQLSN